MNARPHSPSAKKKYQWSGIDDRRRDVFFALATLEPHHRHT
jgi:hypothetical protein